MRVVTGLRLLLCGCIHVSSRARPRFVFFTALEAQQPCTEYHALHAMSIALLR